MPNPAVAQETTPVQIEAYCCPTPGCGNVFASRSMPDLSKQWTGVNLDDRAEYARKHGTPDKHNRAQCPDCRQRMPPIYVERVKVTTVVHVPVAGPDHPSGNAHPM